MGASITIAGEKLIAQKFVAKQPLNVVRFIFANVPGLDATLAVDRAAAKPPAAQIVYVHDLTSDSAGYVNPNQVVYSAQIGSDIGDWDFNWIGLETDEGILFAASIVAQQQKRRNIPPLQVGNNLTRNFLVAFDGAQALTGITIDARTWQHDFTVRLAGQDERERLSNRDVYGRACFFNSALQLEKADNAYRLTPGTAYVEGIRLARSTALPVPPPTFPTTAWLDVALKRELNDVVASWSVVLGTDKIDYEDSLGVQHYCIAIADLPDANTVTDLRPMEPIDGPLVRHFQIRDVISNLTENTILTRLHRGLVLVDATAGPRKITLPLADATLGVVDIVVRRTDNAGNRLVVQCSGVDRIRFHTHLRPTGYPFLTLMGAGDWWHLRSDGAGSWWPIGRCDNTPLGRPVFETTTIFQPGGYGALSSSVLIRAEWPWLWDHAKVSGMLTTEADRIGREGGWTSGDGALTFRGPEGRGEFLRVLDEGRGADANRVAGSSQIASLLPGDNNLNDEIIYVHNSGDRAGLGWEPFLGSPASGTVKYATPSNAINNPEVIGAHSGAARPRNIAYPGRIKLI
ncbi:phage tail protein [Pseudomonas amygdali pv. morsprunorum]|nr:phage tail protein [Pseudomonas amygdali pv. morsprunorum]PPS36614.1 phage tail protein [Pseudomonas amygdali pv. morsprunorum]